MTSITSSPEAAAHAVAEAYSAAARALDVDALLALYAPDAVIYDLFGSEPFTTAEAWRSQVEEWFGSLEPGDVNTAAFGELTTFTAEALVLAHGIVRYGMAGPDGADKGGITNRLTWALRQGADGAWRIVHEHTSAPVDMETGTLIDH